MAASQCRPIECGGYSEAGWKFENHRLMMFDRVRSIPQVKFTSAKFSVQTKHCLISRFNAICGGQYRLNGYMFKSVQNQLGRGYNSTVATLDVRPLPVLQNIV